MTQKASDKVLVQLRMTGSDGFSADDAWAKRIVGSEICPHCNWVYARIQSIDAIVNNRRRRTDLDSVGGFIAGVRVFSTDFIEVVGPEQIDRVAGLGRVIDVRGFEHEGHRTAVARRESVVLRGSEQSDPGLCKKCGRLLYAAGGDKYVLRSQLPDDPIFLSDGKCFCTDQFWKDHIYGAKLTRVEALEFPIRDRPEDGLPASNKALKAYLKSHKMFK